MSNAPSPAKFPWLAVAGMFVLALVGVALLAYMVYTLLNPPAAPAPPSPTLAATAAALIPTTTAAPPTAAPTEAPPPTEAPTEALPPTEAPTATPAAELTIALPANVRAGPGLTFSTIGGLNTGTVVSVLGRDGSATWFAIPYEASTSGVGWVSNQVVTFNGDLNALPVIESAPPPPPPPPGTTATTAPPTGTAPPPASATPAQLSSRGIIATLWRVRNPTAAVNEQVWFDFSVTNTSDQDVSYGALAAHTDVGYTAQSWTNETLRAGDTLTWDDHIEFGQAGTYQLYLGICYGGREACLTGGAPWERLSNYVTVTIH